MSKKYKDQPEKKYKRTPRLQEKADAWLDERVNQPLASKGLGGLGAGISAAGSTLASLLDSEDNEMAMTAPGVGSAGSKLAKDAARKKRIYLKRLDKEIADAQKAAKNTKEQRFNYSDLAIPEKEAKQKAIDKARTIKKHERFGTEK